MKTRDKHSFNRNTTIISPESLDLTENAPSAPKDENPFKKAH